MLERDRERERERESFFRGQLALRRSPSTPTIRVLPTTQSPTSPINNFTTDQLTTAHTPTDNTLERERELQRERLRHEILPVIQWYSSDDFSDYSTED